MEPTPPTDKPYSIYRVPEDALDRAALPRGGRNAPRQAGGRTGRGLRLLFIVLVVAAVAGSIALVTLRPFAGNGAATADEGRPPDAAMAPSADPSLSPTATPTPTPTATPRPAPSFSVTGGGDVIGGFAVSGVVARYGSGLFKGIAPYLKTSDFAFVNLESPLTYNGDPQTWKDVIIKGNPRLAPAMAKSGVDVVTMANNHAGDQGDSGLMDSIRYCKKHRIAVVGAGKDLATARRGVVLKKHGVKVAFLGFSDVLPAGFPATSSSPGIAPGRANISAVRKAIRSAARKSDFVVVGWHWNLEYKRAPTALEKSEGKAAINAGADLVFAHHPHLLDGVQAYRGGLICYSLGNLVFSGFAGETAQTVLVKAKITKRSIDAQLIPVKISGSGVPTAAKGYLASVILKRVKHLSAALGTKVKISGGRGYVHVRR